MIYIHVSHRQIHRQNTQMIFTCILYTDTQTKHPDDICIYLIHRQNTQMIYTCVMGKRGNVEINKSPQAGIETGAFRSKIQHSTE